MSTPYTPILATLGYVYDRERDRVLLIHRDAREDDQHFGKYNGLGGKVERDEDVVAGMRRELREESGLEASRLLLAGTISWPGFGKNGEDWFAFLFRLEGFSGALRDRNDEGRLLWVSRGALDELPMWEGDRLFLPLVFAEPLRPFHGVMPYHEGRPTSWHFSYLDA
ncbi:MAG: 7,8-dihydro-8-oxoguanine triphosphatase [Proteobacteria bacterium]|nr:MAG: 7,8-dihydro-8-oxoguanine triphosphatase [Pseudomonadota bacterium]